MQKIVEAVKLTMQGMESGHDWSHIQRVTALSLSIGNRELSRGRLPNIEIVELGALLHDIADWKFHGGDFEAGPKKAAELLNEQQFAPEVIERVMDIIRQVSYKGAKVDSTPLTLEGQIVQDADRLDAMGAIGIARCFSYGGFRGRTMYDPIIPPVLHESFEQYKNSEGTTVNHFYEKLLLLKDRMNTESGREMAEGRHVVMQQFLEQFHQEWVGSK